MTTQSGAGFALVAPITGVLVPLEEVPDPAFAKKMVGDGVSIDPLSNELVAPCDGTVTVLHASKHAVSIRTPEGLEVLMHIGLDTVGLNGEGFTAHVAQGAQVRTGDRLISFDADLVAQRAAALLTQVLVTNGDAVSSMTPRTGLVTAGRDVVLDVELAAPAGAAGGTGAASAAATAATGAAAAVTGERFALPNPTGLHARPASVLVQAAKAYGSKVTLHAGEQTADAKSVMMLMALGLPKGAEVYLSAEGDDAQAAVDDLTAQMKAGLGEEVAAAPAAAAANTKPAAKPAGGSTAVSMSQPPADPNLLRGVSASPGIGVGQVVHVRRAEFQLAETAGMPDDERRTLDLAVDHAEAELKALREDLAAQGDEERAAIFGAHQEILRDPALLDAAHRLVAEGKSAGWAWRQAFTEQADTLAGLDNEVLAGRATDVRDVGARVLGEITGQKADAAELPSGAILVAEDLTPSDTAKLDRSKVAGFATVHGGASSHVAIIARSLDIPAVAGIDARALELPEGTKVVLDGSKGTVRLGVSDDELARIADLQQRRAARRERELAAAFDPATTSDGHHVEVVANIGNLDDARDSQPKGADGVGLLRSEFVFMGRDAAPTEDEQAQIYTDIANALAPGQPLVIRTLDVGGDKPLPYLPIPAEENPFLGERGVRVGLAQPEILRTQARAILRAARDSHAKIHVMFPMIATLEDLRAAKAIVEAERVALDAPVIPVGIMMEVPSVAVMAAQFAAEADFFSVGTNDLTQYTLAMDRGHPRLAPQVDGCNPAVLGLIGQAVQAAHAAGKWVGVCGGLASDPQAVPILVGLGVDELSASIPAVPAVKAQVRSMTLAQCQDLARQALAADTASAVRALVTLDDDA